METHQGHAADCNWPRLAAKAKENELRPGVLVAVRWWQANTEVKIKACFNDLAHVRYIRLCLVWHMISQMSEMVCVAKV